MTIHPTCEHQAHPRFCVACAGISPEMVPDPGVVPVAFRSAWDEGIRLAGEPRVPDWTHRCPQQSRPQRAGTALAWMFLGAALMVFALGTLEALA